MLNIEIEVQGCESSDISVTNQCETLTLEIIDAPVSTGVVIDDALAASLDPEYSVRWKSANGFVTLNAEQILAMAQAIRSHVQSCFDREADLLDAINAGTYETEMIDMGWPKVAHEELDDES